MFHSPLTAVWPPTYRHSFIHLMVQSPHVLFVYWDVHERKRNMIAAHYRTPWSSLPKIIRFYAYEEETTAFDRPAMWVDIEVGETSSWYYREAIPKMIYAADYGIANQDGQFVPLLRSNKSRTPRSKSMTTAGTESHGAIVSSADAHPQHPDSASSILSDYHSPFEQFSTYTLYTTQEGAKS
ncbi:DUF4912 domain-containing protein [Paenibacillus sp. 1001270B_150601_E10]|uniref:DUF4912 domain-containing protein n=1 Tax=Paenibacillus sp. 1001270B_150601_E10 TaxID=2787079 RepID=UPI0018A0CE43|nr:DUF4912 domain-containing protein [Paenibacillus sp. 1001270B_150601_E10]